MVFTRDRRIQNLLRNGKTSVGCGLRNIRAKDIYLEAIHVWVEVVEVMNMNEGIQGEHSEGQGTAPWEAAGKEKHTIYGGSGKETRKEEEGDTSQR